MAMDLQALSDRAEIADLMARYAHHGDRGFAAAGADSAALAALFTEDGVWQSGAQMRFVGRSAIAAGLGASPVDFVVHLFVNPLIELAGDTASAQWRAILLLDAGGSARWGISHYRVDYRRTGEGWRIAELTTGAIAWARADDLAVTSVRPRTTGDDV